MKTKATATLEPVAASLNAATIRKYWPVLNMVAKRKTTIPILANVRLGNGTIAATDLDIAVSVPLACGESDVCLSARDFATYVQATNCDPSLSLDASTWQATLDDGRAKLVLQGIKPGDFPILPEVPKATARIDARPMRELIRRCRYAISREESRYTLNGALLEAHGDTLRMVSTDGHRLSLSETRCNDATRLPKPFMVSAKMLDLVAAALDASGADFIEIAKDGAYLFVKIGDIEASEKSLIGQFPNYQTLLKPTKSVATATVNASEAAAAFKLAHHFADERSGAVRLVIDKGLSIHAADGGRSFEQAIAAETTGTISAGFYAGYLADFFSSIDGEATLSFAGPFSAGLFTSATCPEYRHLIMPMRM